MRIEVVQDQASGLWCLEIYDSATATVPSARSEPIYTSADEAENDMRRILLSNFPR